MKKIVLFILFGHHPKKIVSLIYVTDLCSKVHNGEKKDGFRRQYLHYCFSYHHYDPKEKELRYAYDFPRVVSIRSPQSLQNKKMHEKI